MLGTLINLFQYYEKVFDWEIYDNQSEIADNINTRKVFINLGVEDLKAEYDRIKELGIAAQMTEI